MRSLLWSLPLLALAAHANGQGAQVELISVPLQPLNHPGDIGTMQLTADEPPPAPNAGFHRPGEGAAPSVYVSAQPAAPPSLAANPNGDPAWGASHAVSIRPPAPAAPRIYIQPQNGYESYLSAAILKKHVPVVLTQKQEEASFTLVGMIQSKDETTGSKVLNCVVLFCAGINGSTDATAQLITPAGEIAWAYSLHQIVKDEFRRSAEDIAKHLKDFLEKHPQ